MDGNAPFGAPPPFFRCGCFVVVVGKTLIGKIRMPKHPRERIATFHPSPRVHPVCDVAHPWYEETRLAPYRVRCDLFASGQQELIAAAYRYRARAVAFRQKIRRARHCGEWMMRVSLRLILVVLLVAEVRRWRKMPARWTKSRCRRWNNPDAPSTPAKELFGRETDAGSAGRPIDRRICRRAAWPARSRCRSTARPGR